MRPILVDDDGLEPVWFFPKTLIQAGFASSRSNIYDQIKNGTLPPPIKEKPGVMQSGAKFHGATVRHLHRERIQKFRTAEAAAK